MFNSLTLTKSFNIPVTIINCKENIKIDHAIFQYIMEDFVIYWKEKSKIFPYYCHICGYAFKCHITDIINSRCQFFNKNREESSSY